MNRSTRSCAVLQGCPLRRSRARHGSTDSARTCSAQSSSGQRHGAGRVSPKPHLRTPGYARYLFLPAAGERGSPRCKSCSCATGMAWYGQAMKILSWDGQGAYVRGPRRLFSGNGGLLSTAHDYARFLQMLLNDGELDGARIVSPASVRLMTVNHVGDLYARLVSGDGIRFQRRGQAGSRSGRLRGSGARLSGCVRLGRCWLHEVLGRPGPKPHRRVHDANTPNHG